MDDLIQRQAVLEMAYDMSEIDGEHFTKPCMVVDVEDIQKLPPVTQKSETVTEFADRCRECGAKYGKLLKQEPCEDAISRQAVIDITWEEPSYTDALNVLTEVRDKVKALPPVKPQEKTGHWIMPQQDDGMSDPIYYQVRCSECGFDLDPQTWDMELHQYDADKYCPKCGAMMVEEQESEEV